MRMHLSVILVCGLAVGLCPAKVRAQGHEGSESAQPRPEKMAEPSPMAVALLDLARELVGKGQTDTATNAVARALEMAPSLAEVVAADPVLAELAAQREPVREAPQPPPKLGGESLDVWLTGSQIWSSPAFDEGVVYFGSDDGFLYSLTLEPLMPRWRFMTAGRVRSTPAISHGRVLFTSDDGFLYCVGSEDGEEIWRFKLGGADVARVLPSLYPPRSYDFLASSPVVAGGLVVVGSADGSVYAVDCESGRKRWRFRTDGMIRATPTVRGNVVYIGSWDHNLYALDLSRGRERWRFDTGGVVQSTAAVGESRVFVGSRSGSLFAVDADSGELVWKLDLDDGSWVESSPVYADDHVYVGSSDALQLLAVNAADGSVAWTYPTGGWTWSTPAVTEARVYVGAISSFPYYHRGTELHHGLHAVDRQSGELLWKIETADLPGYLTGGVVSAPLVVEGRVVFGSLDHHLHVVRE